MLKFVLSTPVISDATLNLNSGYLSVAVSLLSVELAMRSNSPFFTIQSFISKVEDGCEPFFLYNQPSSGSQLDPVEF